MKVSYVNGLTVLVEASATLIPGERLELVEQGEVLAWIGLAPSLRASFGVLNLQAVIPTSRVERLEERIVSPT